MQTNALPRFLALYAALFAAFGVASPFFGAFLGERGLAPEAIGLVLAAGTAVRLVAGPFGGRVADRLGSLRLVLVAYAAAAALVAFAYLPADGLWLLLLVSVAHSSVLAPITPIADALTLAASKASERTFHYGWVRGAGSGAFILGTLLAGQFVARFGLVTIIWLNGALLGLAASSACLLPDPLRSSPSATRDDAREMESSGRANGFGTLLRLAPFRRMMLVAGLIQGSHALHDGFVVIYWRSVGIGDDTIGLLWSESVAAEVVVFLFFGRWLLDRLSPAGASILAAAGGVVRWVVLAETTSVAASAFVEPLHGLTFALQHLACMRLISVVVPPRLAATAQACYGTVAVGLTSALLTLASGQLYAQLSAGGFWVMAGLCIAAMPVALGLRRLDDDPMA